LNVSSYITQKEVIIFGSYARDEVDEYSDLDFVVIKKTKRQFMERLIEVAKLIRPIRHGKMPMK